MADIYCKIACTKRELAAHFGIRRTVFVEEQKIFDHSDVDSDDRFLVPIVAWHRPGDEIVGAVRCFREHADTWYGGRLAVVEEFRGLTVGARLVKKAEQVVRERDCKRFLAHVQIENVPFFKYLEWEPVGSPKILKGLEHQLMKTTWSQPVDSGLQAEQSA